MAEGSASSPSLKLLCFRVVREHFCALAAHAAAVLPCDLLEELQPHLTVCQLDQLQPALNTRGVSTLSGWSHILRHMRRSFSVKVDSEENAKLLVMSGLFFSVLYDSGSRYIRSNISSLDIPLFLGTAARYTKHLALRNKPETLRRLTTEWRSVLHQLERHVQSVTVSHRLDPSKPVNQPAVLVLHRLLDHGQAREMVFEARCPLTLAWILHRRGSQATDTTAGCSGPSSSSEELQGPASKRPRRDSGTEHEEGGSTDGVEESDAQGDCWGDRVHSKACPRRPIEVLELTQCNTDCLKVLLSALPSWSSLRRLNLHSVGIFTPSSALDLAGALQERSRRPGGGLAELNVCTLPCPSLLERLLEACPHLMGLSAEVHNVPGNWTVRGPPKPQNQCQFPLQRLRISLNQQLVPGPLIPSLVRRCPQLHTLYVSGLRLQSEASYGRLLTTLSESCGSLISLHLEDVNLSDSLEYILLLLKRCRLIDLCLKDCRLLEKWTNKEESLERLTTALSNHRSLRWLGLAHNRIAKHVPVLAQLFSGFPNSSLERVDLSSNFIQPGELLEFSRRVGALRPNRRLTLDLRRNPGDRDPDSWRSAVSSLAPYCNLQLQGWSSTDTMVDHVSNM
uniref:Leucine-rich repeat-containing protein 41 n=1 Tax=Neogobius melanostomus TaxID=47308 RepID=A0A8C6UND0_9GOBI